MKNTDIKKTTTNVRLFSRDGGAVTDLAISPFNEPPEILIWGSRVFLRPHPDLYGHRHVRDLPVEDKVTFYVESWVWQVPS